MTLSWTLGCSLLAMAAAGSLSVRSLYSAEDCSGTPYLEEKNIQDTCMQWPWEDGLYVTYTCNSTTAVSNWYIDAACTTYRDNGPITYADVGVCANGVKSTCRDGTFAVVAQYSDSACTTKQMDRNIVVECSAFGSSIQTGSQKASVGDTFTHSLYNSSDCTGDATETMEVASCGNCTSVSGGVYVMWDCTTSTTVTSTMSLTVTVTSTGLTSGTSLTSPMKLHLLTGMVGFVFLVLNFWEPSLNIWAVTKTLTIRCI